MRWMGSVCRRVVRIACLSRWELSWHLSDEKRAAMWSPGNIMSQAEGTASANAWGGNQMKVFKEQRKSWHSWRRMRDGRPQEVRLDGEGRGQDHGGRWESAVWLLLLALKVDFLFIKHQNPDKNTKSIIFNVLLRNYNIMRWVKGTC